MPRIITKEDKAARKAQQKRKAKAAFAEKATAQLLEEAHVHWAGLGLDAAYGEHDDDEEGDREHAAYFDNPFGEGSSKGFGGLRRRPTPYPFGQASRMRSYGDPSHASRSSLHLATQSSARALKRRTVPAARNLNQLYHDDLKGPRASKLLSPNISTTALPGSPRYDSSRGSSVADLHPWVESERDTDECFPCAWRAKPFGDYNGSDRDRIEFSNGRKGKGKGRAGSMHAEDESSWGSESTAYSSSGMRVEPRDSALGTSIPNTPSCRNRPLGVEGAVSGSEDSVIADDVPTTTEGDRSLIEAQESINGLAVATDRENQGNTDEATVDRDSGIHVNGSDEEKFADDVRTMSLYLERHGTKKGLPEEPKQDPDGGDGMDPGDSTH